MVDLHESQLHTKNKRSNFSRSDTKETYYVDAYRVDRIVKTKTHRRACKVAYDPLCTIYRTYVNNVTLLNCKGRLMRCSRAVCLISDKIALSVKNTSFLMQCEIIWNQVIKVSTKTFYHSVNS